MRWKTITLLTMLFASSVRRLLAAGADPNAHNEDGLTPLHQVSLSLGLIEENVHFSFCF